jgi:hypothetical protein
LQDLEAHMSREAHARLSLGLPANVCHIIDESSPLHDLSVVTMADRKMEARLNSFPLRIVFRVSGHVVLMVHMLPAWRR